MPTEVGEKTQDSHRNIRCVCVCVCVCVSESVSVCVSETHLRVVGVTRARAPSHLLGLHPVALDCGVMFTVAKGNTVLLLTADWVGFKG